VFDIFNTNTIRASRDSGNFTSGYWDGLLLNVTRQEGSLPFSSDLRPQAQFLAMEPYPASSWSISPPALQQLQSVLMRAGNATGNSTAETIPSVAIQLDYEFTRAGPPTYEVISSTNSQVLSPLDALGLYNSLNSVSGAVSSLSETVASSNGVASGVLLVPVGSPTLVSKMYPYVQRLPATTEAIGLTKQSMRSIQLQLYSGVKSSGGQVSTSMWWTLNIAPYPEDSFGSLPGDGLEFNVISDRVAPDILVQTLGGYSILAVYTLIIVTIGGLIRGLFFLPVERVPYQEMEQVHDLLELCDGIRLAQNETAFDRHLENEMYLYRLLLRLHRSPEVVLRITKLSQRKDIEPDDYGQTIV